MRWLAVLFALQIFNVEARASILNAKPADITEVSLLKNEAFRCRSSSQEFALELKVGVSGNLYHRIFCQDDTERSRWEGMYAEILKILAGLPSQSCLLSEKCYRWGCEREFGKTHADIHNMIILTSSGNKIEDYRVTLQIGCYK